jgi:hypothetical protein
LHMDRPVPRFGNQFCIVLGGTLELKRCFWYLVFWQWVNRHPQMAPNMSCSWIIALTSGNVSNYQVIPRLEVWEAWWSLGVQPAPDGNFCKEGNFLLEKANQYATRLSMSRLSEMDMFIFHQSTYSLLMSYSLPVMMLDNKTLNKIQQWVVQAILNKLGVSKSFPHYVAFGPKDLCSMALLDISVEEGVRGVQHFTDHLFLRDSVGNLILIALRSLQVESGCGFHLLENPGEWVPYITSCWLTSIWDFLNQNKIKIKVASAWWEHTSQANDCHVMDKFQKLGIYDDCQLFESSSWGCPG